MSKFKFLMLPLFVGLLIITSCSEDDSVVNEAQVLIEYLESTNSLLGKDYVNTDLPSIIKSTDVKTLNATGDVYIIDTRSAADFASGHIENAVNVSAGNVLSHVESNDLSAYQKIVVVCYTGQTAGWATSILRLMSYENAFSMKWGMSAWHSDFSADWWDAKISNARALDFTSDATAKGPAGDLPVISTGATTGEEILKARAAAVMTEGFTPVKVTSTQVFDNPDNYYIINYWSEAHYSEPGHIPGAMQYTPKQTIKLDVDLKTLPTDKTIVVYCYTGQTSAFICAYLRLFGYDAKSLVFGANGMIYDIMNAREDMKTSTVWNQSQKHDYDYEVTQ